MTLRTIIIPASVQPNARALCKGLAGVPGDGMFVTGLSATGQAPATHYISSGPISEGMAALVVGGRSLGLQLGQHLVSPGEHPASVLLTAMRAVGGAGVTALGDLSNDIVGLRV